MTCPPRLILARPVGTSPSAPSQHVEEPGACQENGARRARREGRRREGAVVRLLIRRGGSPVRVDRRLPRPSRCPPRAGRRLPRAVCRLRRDRCRFLSRRRVQLCAVDLPVRYLFDGAAEGVERALRRSVVPEGCRLPPLEPLLVPE